MNKKNNARFIVTGAVIAAAYAGLTYLSNAFGLAYGAFQLRLSEAFTVLAVFSPSAVWGLSVGCFIANIGSFNMLDMVFGTLATLVSAVLSYKLRNVRFKNLPLLSFVIPIPVNALAVGLEIAFFLEKKAFWWSFLISALEVGVGEAVVCLVFGIPLYLAVSKYGIFKDNTKI